uniref:Reverse transcriptase domain-containing protein n=1 Tax=Megaselia scalaris TaxID=36166 RepID=T1H1H0_MEGSC
MSSALLAPINAILGVKATGGVSEKFQTLRGFRQGDALTCSFFNIIRAAEIDTKNMIANKSRQILGYEDDFEVVKDFIYLGSE